MSGKGKRNRKRKRKSSIPTVKMYPIPPDLVGHKLCLFETCLAVATKTICAEPERCYRNNEDETCQQFVACDEHADPLAMLVQKLLTEPGTVEPTPPEGQFGGHD
jgi:hypothetical protein